MIEEVRLQMITDEYVMLQGFYEDIDNRGLTIKGWSISVALAGMGAAFLYSGQLFLYVMLAALLFWYLEGYWRGLSFFFSSRILEIEAALRGDNLEKFTPLQTYKTWNQKFNAKRRPDLALYEEIRQHVSACFDRGREFGFVYSVGDGCD